MVVAGAVGMEVMVAAGAVGMEAMVVGTVTTVRDPIYIYN